MRHPSFLRWVSFSYLVELRLTKVKPLSFGLKTTLSCFCGSAAVLTVLEEIISTLVEYKKCSTTVGHFLLSLWEQLNLPLQASEVILDSEVHFVSEVLPNGKVANLTSLVHSTNFTAKQLHFCDSKNLTISLLSCFQRIQSQEPLIYRARFALIKKGGSICKKLSRPIYFLPFLWYNLTNQ